MTDNTSNTRDTNIFRLTCPDGMLVGRALGKKVFEECIARLEGAGTGPVLEMDFSGIRFVDFSCADEFLGRLSSRIVSRELADTCLLLTHCNVEVRENIDAMLKIKGHAMLCKDNTGATHLLGKLHPQLQDTLQFARKRGELTARDLADAEQIAINASSNRLTKLANLGLLGRKEEPAAGKGGKQFRYHSIVEW